MINCYAFGSVPPFAKGLVRDLRVRWALEEAGLPYRVTLVGDDEGLMPRAGYRLVQPFGPFGEQFADLSHELFARKMRARRRQHLQTRGQEAVAVQMIERGEQHAPGEVARRAEQNDRIRLPRLDHAHTPQLAGGGCAEPAGASSRRGRSRGT